MSYRSSSGSRSQFESNALSKYRIMSPWDCFESPKRTHKRFFFFSTVLCVTVALRITIDNHLNESVRLLPLDIFRPHALYYVLETTSIGSLAQYSENFFR